eukprot:CAMPEP_0194205896 /NCGR_PEP_ID=MMETSP0156-20130528/5062_1 /TAXON_ID=33649 /ORGANISM="Thalassionema nitzschioides, Strain L26-B" /LENGTH=705 /DNA_ID=CAMNT_0038932281 /DNA_START=340 /DNA_END=2457 /DNA_ORIENTATION=-
MTDPISGKQRNILDAFPMPSHSTRHQNTNAFDEDAYQDYANMLDDVMKQASSWYKGSQEVTKWLKSEERLMEYHLPTLDRAIREDGVDPNDMELRDELEKQRVDFLEKLSIDEKDYELAKNILIKIGRVCASRAKSRPLDIAWEKVKEAGMYMKDDTLSNYLYVVSTYPSMSMSLGPFESIFDVFDPSKESENENDIDSTKFQEDGESRKRDISEEIAAFYDCIYVPTEQSTSVRVKALVRKGNAKGAEMLLENSGMTKLRLRSFQPILKQYLQQGDLRAALSLYSRMRSEPNVNLDAETYVQVIANIAEKGHFCHDSLPIDGVDEYGFSTSNGPEFLDQLVTDMSEDVIEISSALAKRLHTAIQKSFKDKKSGRNLEEQHPLAPLKQEIDSAEADETLACRVTIDKTTGACPRSGARLRLIKLAKSEREHLKTKLFELADTLQKNFVKNRKKKDKPQPKVTASKMLQSFSAWLDKRKGKPFTAIVDGANVAYYLQNFEEGKFNFHQIKFMVDTLEGMNEKPLVVLPSKYVGKSFYVIRGNGVQKQRLSEVDWAILNRLRDAGMLYVVQENNLDDLYWMLASISEQEKSRQGVSLDVSVEDPSGRWPGTRPMLVSNDQMRDHKLGLVEPRLFRRWYASHIVNYTFTGFVGDECVDDEIMFSPADFFSQEIQSNISTFGFSEGTGTRVWHFPVNDWNENERFCLRV